MVASFFRQRGNRVVYANAGSAIVAGDIVVRASGSSGCVGIAVNAIPATTGTGNLDIEGVFTCPKETGEAFTDGQKVYFDGTAATGTSSTTFTYMGRAVGASASADTTANININVP